MSKENKSKWTFFTNHSHVLFYLYTNPPAPLRAVADSIGITERAVQSIITDLEEGGVITRYREGRQNRYRINPEVSLRHPLEAHHNIGEMLEIMKEGQQRRH